MINFVNNRGCILSSVVIILCNKKAPNANVSVIIMRWDVICCSFFKFPVTFLTLVILRLPSLYFCLLIAILDYQLCFNDSKQKQRFEVIHFKVCVCVNLLCISRIHTYFTSGWFPRRKIKLFLTTLLLIVINFFSRDYKFFGEYFLFIGFLFYRVWTL